VGPRRGCNPVDRKKIAEFFKSVGRFADGARRFFLFASANAVKRVVIAVVSILVGFAGPILAMNDLKAIWHSPQWFWDAFAEHASHNSSEFADIILACMPAGFLCLTDLIAHVFDDDFKYARSRLTYLGIFCVAAAALFCGALLIAGYVAIKWAPASGNPSWVGQFEYAWPMSKYILEFTLLFELLLAWAETLHEAQDRQWQF